MPVMVELWRSGAMVLCCAILLSALAEPDYNTAEIIRAYSNRILHRFD